MTSLAHPNSPSILHAAFLSILPRIETHARFSFRFWRCAQRRDDAIAEVVALCWAWFVRLVERGRDPVPLAGSLARFAVKQVRSGRKLCGKARAHDVFTAATQRDQGFAVVPLPQYSSLTGTPFEDALQDNTTTPIPDQVAFRIDWPAWLATLPWRDQALVQDLALGHGTQHMAAKYGVSPGRVSQKRREFQGSWRGYGRERSVAPAAAE